MLHEAAREPPGAQHTHEHQQQQQHEGQHHTPQQHHQQHNHGEGEQQEQHAERLGGGIGDAWLWMGDVGARLMAAAREEGGLLPAMSEQVGSRRQEGK